MADGDAVADEVLARAKDAGLAVITQHWQTMTPDLPCHLEEFEARLRRAASFDPARGNLIRRLLGLGVLGQRLWPLRVGRGLPGDHHAGNQSPARLVYHDQREPERSTRPWTHLHFQSRDPALRGIDPDTLADGQLWPGWAKKLGLPAGIPISIGEFDVHYRVIGCGVREGTLAI